MTLTHLFHVPNDGHSPAARHTSITLNTQPSFPGTPSTAHGVNRVTPPPPSTIEQLRSSHITSLLLSPLIQEQRSTPAEREASSIHALAPPCRIDHPCRISLIIWFSSRSSSRPSLPSLQPPAVLTRPPHSLSPRHPDGGGRARPGAAARQHAPHGMAAHHACTLRWLPAECVLRCWP